MGTAELSSGDTRTSITDLDSCTRPRPAANGVRIVLAFGSLWIITLIGAVIGIAAPTVAPGGPPQPTLHGTLGDFTSIAETNARILSAPFLLALFRFPAQRSTRRLGDLVIGGVLGANALRVGLALGRWHAHLLPYLPQLPLEWLAAALAAASWLALRTSVRPRTALAYLAAVLGLVIAAAAVETIATPHASPRPQHPVSSVITALSPSNVPDPCQGAHMVPSPVAGSTVGCLRRFSPTVGRTASRSTSVSLPLARGLDSASGRRPAVRATSTTGSPQGGNQR